MPNLSNCGKCNSKIIQGGIDESTGELVCSDCITQSDNQLYSFSIINKLISLHLDELITFSRKKEIIDSIKLLYEFLSYHIEGLKKVKSMAMVRSILDKEEF